MLQTLVHVRFPPRLPGCSSRFLPLSGGHLPRGPCFTSTGRRAQAQTAATGLERLGSLVLDLPAATLAALGRRSGPGEAGDGGRLASGGLPPLLALAVPTTRRAAQDQ